MYTIVLAIILIASFLCPDMYNCPFLIKLTFDHLTLELMQREQHPSPRLSQGCNLIVMICLQFFYNLGDGLSEAALATGPDPLEGMAYS